MEKRYCIFDMDGTLVDSMPYWSTLSLDYLRGRGIEEERLEGLLEEIKTMTTPEASLYLKEKYGLPESSEDICRAFMDTMRAHYAQDVSLKKGVRPYLEKLRAQGARLCVLTATSIPLVRVCLGKLGIRDCFDFLMSCEEAGRGKDYPDAFLMAAERLGASPGETAVFEDSFQALRTARGAGFYTVAVHDDSAGAEWEKSCGLADEAVLDFEKAW